MKLELITHYGISVNFPEETSRRTQNGLIKWHNENKIEMASAPDIYEALKNRRERPKIVRTIHEENGVITGSKQIHKNQNLGRLAHNYGSISREVKTSEEIKIPFFPGTPIKHITCFQAQKIDQVLESEEGLKYMQAVLGTDDNSRKMLKRLTNSFGRYLFVSTPEGFTRTSETFGKKITPIVFYYMHGIYSIDSTWKVNNERSRSMKVLEQRLEEVPLK